ncbi:UDP-glucose:glycoprotein glucosyltransferase-like [Dorcoceras hygrometricum]|uniref:UDP-glucose:glycoprotein glucosyltransferase-like n=1 Tax=Dorcoceras hygrometricum TaxID=472368 RepID=A0A2Z7AUR4_9LAMI|nr:UDP-glucose:glycoprotein glucosyltransferase-like [Dorcoceras hygrometricum]
MLLLLATGSSKASPESSCDWMLCVATGCTVASSAEITTQSLPAKSSSQEQNAVLATGCLLYDVASLCVWMQATADSCDWLHKSSAEYDDVTDDVISTNPSAESQHDVASSYALRFIC